MPVNDFVLTDGAAPPALLTKQIANGTRDEAGRWLRAARDGECGDCGSPVQPTDDMCPHCGAA